MRKTQGMNIRAAHAGFRSGWLLAAGLFVLSSAALGQDAAEDFKQNCAVCHSIGEGRLVGPDLKGITARREKAWLLRVITEPDKMAAGDKVFMELVKEYSGVTMPALPNMTRERAERLLAYISDAAPAPAAAGPAEAAFSAEDVAAGRRLFMGHDRLKAGSPSCVSCHSAGAMPWLGGGKLGPDLSDAFSRLGSEKGLSAWLSSPASPVMRPVYGNRPLEAAEISALVAFFKDVAARGRRSDAIARLSFLIIGILGAAAAFIAIDSIWSGRLTGVRRTLAARPPGVVIKERS